MDRCNNNSASEHGTVLLSTLLVMSVMSAVALALLVTVQTAVTRTIDINARAQVDLYTVGARDFAQIQLQQIAQLDGAELNAQLSALDPIILPFENGSVTLTVADGTHCFRLSALSNSDGSGSDTAQLQFAALMEALGVDNNTASGIASASVDWVDRDSQTRAGGAEDGPYLSRTAPSFASGPHRTANVPMQSVSELRAVEGMTEGLFRALRPYLCIGEPGVQSVFNINTAEPRHAPVLAAILGGGTMAETAAVALIQDRPPGGYSTLEQVPALAGYDNPAASFGDIVYAPRRVTAEVIVQYGDIRQAQFLAFEGLDNAQPTLSYRGFGLESFPSLAWPVPDPEESSP